MDFITMISGAVTPATEKHMLRSANQNSSKFSENSHPKVSHLNSPVSKSAKSASKNHNSVADLPQKKIRQRKFLKTKTNTKKEDDDSRVTCSCIQNHYKDHGKNCLCVSHENLRASQDEYSENRGCNNEENGDLDQSKASDEAQIVLDEVIETSLMIHDLRIEDNYEEIGNLSENINPVESESPNQRRSSTLKRRRAKLLEDARNSLPEFGRVKHLVEAFEKLLSISAAQKQEEAEKTRKATKWALPGLQPPKAPETDVSSSSLFSLSQSDLSLTSQNLGLGPQNTVFTSWDSSLGSLSGGISLGSRRRSRRNSLESSRTSEGNKSKMQQPRVTSQKPFKLRTEERGKMKEEQFMKKLQETLIEEQKQRMPIARGLPSTTDEPECLVKRKSLVKESTRPVDLKLHSDLRAIDRAEFDHQVAEKMSLREQYKMDRERQQKLAEEEEIRRLRKELIPKAQPMPCFDRPFIPRRSTKPPTIPREPKFHIPQHKKSRSCHL